MGKSPHYTDFHWNLCSSCRPRHNHACKLLDWNGILDGVKFPIFLFIPPWALQQCSANALPVITILQGFRDRKVTYRTTLSIIRRETNCECVYSVTCVVDAFDNCDRSPQFYAAVVQLILPQANSAKSGVVWISIGLAEFDNKDGKIPPKAERLACVRLSHACAVRTCTRESRCISMPYWIM